MHIAHRISAVSDSGEQFWLTTINKWDEIAFPSHVKGVKAQSVRTHTQILAKTSNRQKHICFGTEEKNCHRVKVLVHMVIKIVFFFRLFINGYYLRSAPFWWGIPISSISLDGNANFSNFPIYPNASTNKKNAPELNETKKNCSNFNPSYFYLGKRGWI